MFFEVSSSAKAIIDDIVGKLSPSVWKLLVARSSSQSLPAVAYTLTSITANSGLHSHLHHRWQRLTLSPPSQPAVACLSSLGWCCSCLGRTCRKCGPSSPLSSRAPARPLMKKQLGAVILSPTWGKIKRYLLNSPLWKWARLN